MGVLFAWLLRGLVYLLSFLFRGLITSVSWLGTSTIGSFLTFGVSLFVILHSAVNWIKQMVMKFLPTPATSFELDLAYTFSDLFDSYFLTLLGDDPFSMVVRDLLYVFNFGSLIDGIISIFLPFLLTVWSYKTVKSWLPTLSS